MRRIFSFVLLGSLLIRIASGADDSFKASQSRIAETMEAFGRSKAKIFLYSLDPNDPRIIEGKRPNNPDKVFYGYPILGKVEIVPPQERIKLLNAFAKGVRESSGDAANCFNPRHGIRIITETSTNDFVICFECLQVQTYGFNGGQFFSTSSSPGIVFNGFLSQYHIKRAE